MTKLTLPTPSRLRRMSVRKRTETFLAWVKTQPAHGTYDPISSNCALVQFARAIKPGIEAYASGRGVESLTPDGSEMRIIGASPFSPIWAPEGEQDRYTMTFGALRCNLERHLAATA